MIRYNYTPDGSVEWSVIRQGKVVAEGVTAHIDEARTASEKAVIDAYNAEKISTVVLCGSGENQLSLLKSTK